MKKSTKHLPRESLGDSYNSVWVFLLGNPNLEDHIFDIWMIVANWSGIAKYTQRPKTITIANLVWYCPKNRRRLCPNKLDLYQVLMGNIEKDMRVFICPERPVGFGFKKIY